MHPDSRFAIEDRATLLAFLAAHPFVTLAASIKDAPMIAQAPIVIHEIGGEIALDFHVSRGSVLAPHVPARSGTPCWRPDPAAAAASA